MTRQSSIEAFHSSIVNRHSKSGADHCTVATPCRSPGMIESPAGGKRELRRELFVDVDAEPGRFGRIHITIPDLGASGKDLARLGRENISLVDAEVVACQLKSESGCV